MSERTSFTDALSEVIELRRQVTRRGKELDERIAERRKVVIQALRDSNGSFRPPGLPAAFEHLQKWRGERHKLHEQLKHAELQLQEIDFDLAMEFLTDLDQED